MEKFTEYFFFFFLLLLIPSIAADLRDDSWPRPEKNGFLPRRNPKELLSNFFRRAASRRIIYESPQIFNVRKDFRVFNVVSYGADPSGVRDSTDAIVRAVAAASSAQSGSEMLPGITDLRGVVIDLAGGNYRVSRPLRFPAGVGNILVEHGTLRASPSFPESEYLIELRSPESNLPPTAADVSASSHPMNKKNVGIYYEDITFRDVLFDSSFRGGGLLVVDSARIRVDHCFFSHFTTVGILVRGGHETFISSTFLGQHLTVGGDPDERFFSGTGIDLSSNDNAVTDVVVFSAATGVVLRGQANILTGVHCYNKATGLGGIGVEVKLPGKSQTRIDNCYLDWTGIVLEDPVQVHVTDAFFLGNANVLLRSVNGKISGLTIENNMFTGEGWTTAIVALDESKKPFTAVDQVVVDRNNVWGMKLKSTEGRRTVGGKGMRWEADFSDLLLVPQQIKHVQYSFFTKDRNFPAHALTAVEGGLVVVESDRAADAVVSVQVDQYVQLGEEGVFY